MAEDRAIFRLLPFYSDNALLSIGLDLAFAATRCFLRYNFESSALRRIQAAPSLHISDLRSLIVDDAQSESQDEPLVFVRGTVGVKSAVNGGSWKSLRTPELLVSQESGEKAVVVQRERTWLYSRWRGISGKVYGADAILGESLNKQEITSMQTVPFILAEGDRWLNVNLVDSIQPLPLTTVYHHLKPVDVSSYTFFQVFCGTKFPVGLLNEEKILPLGKEVSAVGICSFNDGVPEIKSCPELPYFLSGITKDQMVSDLEVRTKALWRSGVILGSLSAVLISYAVIRYWKKWKAWRLARRRRVRANEDIGQVEEEDDVPEHEHCVICWIRKRKSAFIPCGHLVCCQVCAARLLSVASPKCPICVQNIYSSVRIHKP